MLAFQSPVRYSAHPSDSPHAVFRLQLDSPAGRFQGEIRIAKALGCRGQYVGHLVLPSIMRGEFGRLVDKRLDQQ